MKKIFTMLLAAALGGIAFTACNSDPAKPLDYSDYKRATVKGKVLVHVDETAAEPKWAAAPSSIVILARVYNSQLAYGAGGYWETKAKYNASTGEYSATVPVSALGSEVDIIIKEWTGTVKRTDNTVSPAVVKDYSVIWYSNGTYANLEPGDEIIERNIRYAGQGTYQGNYRLIEAGVGGNVY